MNKVTVQTKFDYKTMKYLNLYLMKYKRKSLLLYIILLVLSLGGGTYLFVSSLGSENGPNYVWPVAFGLISLYTLYQMLTIERNLDKHLRNYFRSRPLLTETIEVSDEKLVITVCTRPNKPQEYDWAYVNEICELPGYYFLFMNNNTPIILEKNHEAFLDGTLEELDIILKEKIQTKPYKKCDREIVKRPIPEINYIDPVIEEDEPTEEEKAEACEVEVIEAKTVGSEEEARTEEVAKEEVSSEEVAQEEAAEEETKEE